MKIKINAIEYYLPSKTEDNGVLKKDNPSWSVQDIEKKTGIRLRHIASSEQTATDMAILAAEKLFSESVKKDNIDFIILVTQSPDYVLPTSACIIQDRLGIKKSSMAFDVNLGCSGFIYALAIAGSLIESKTVKEGLIICSETYTKYVDKSDRACRSLFGDGAATIHITPSNSDILGPFDFGTDGSGYKNLIVYSSGARVSKTKVHERKLFMDGPKVFMFTMNAVPVSVDTLLKKSGKSIKDIDLFIFHQASKVVLDNIVRRLGIPENKVFNNYQLIGNTVSASIPIAIKDALEKKRIKKGDFIMLVGFGVGYSWGSCLMKWEG